MGFTCSLTHSFRFSYTAGVGNDLVEREIDHVFVSRVRTADVRPHDDEVVDWRWIDPDDLASDVEARPEVYTAWFRLLLRRPELSAATAAPSPAG
jgi:isopentenyl-diphosphate delta-isomerase